ncbi:MAG: ParA family protein [Gammaproteobacteria bacterium]|nr:ParA family protein [Gammaproteobacteria bacterium]
MIRIVVINAKGGCGKSTISTNLASFYASKGFRTALYDYDQQGSSMRWLEARPKSVANIYGVTAHRTAAKGVTMSWHLRTPPDIARLVVDTPPGLTGTELVDQLKGADYILIPMLPSWLDICATADFLRELIVNIKVHRGKARMAIISNRVRKNTTAYRELDRFLKKLNIPVLAQLRDTQNYNRVVKAGLGIHEVYHPTTEIDQKHWQSIFNWIEISAKNKSILAGSPEQLTSAIYDEEKLRIVS